MIVCLQGSVGTGRCGTEKGQSTALVEGSRVHHSNQPGGSKTRLYIWAFPDSEPLSWNVNGAGLVVVSASGARTPSRRGPRTDRPVCEPCRGHHHGRLGRGQTERRQFPLGELDKVRGDQPYFFFFFCSSCCWSTGESRWISNFGQPPARSKALGRAFQYNNGRPSKSLYTLTFFFFLSLIIAHGRCRYLLPVESSTACSRVAVSASFKVHISGYHVV